jgi:membrane protein
MAQEIFTGIQGASTYYNAIYGALYHLLFLFIWLFWCWLILLFGTEIAYAHQNLDGLTRQFRRPLAPPEPVDEYLCLAALVSIGARFFQRQPPLSRDELGQILPRGNNLADRVAQALQDCNLVVEVVPARAASSPQFLPKLPLDQVTVKEVLDGLRESRGASLDAALAGEPRLIALLKPLAEAPTPVGCEALTLQQLVEAFAGNGPEAKD